MDFWCYGHQSFLMLTLISGNYYQGHRRWLCHPLYNNWPCRFYCRPHLGAWNGISRSVLPVNSKFQFTAELPIRRQDIVGLVRGLCLLVDKCTRGLEHLKICSMLEGYKNSTFVDVSHEIILPIQVWLDTVGVLAKKIGIFSIHFCSGKTCYRGTQWQGSP